MALNATTLGIPCIYYGTEQMFDGEGGGDGADVPAPWSSSSELTTRSSLPISPRRKSIVFWRSISRAGSNDDLMTDENQRNKSTSLSPSIVLGVMSRAFQNFLMLGSSHH